MPKGSGRRGCGGLAPTDISAIQSSGKDMVSPTQQTKRRRYNRDRQLAKAKKRATTRAGTPSFPLHPEGYDPNAADAKQQRN